MFKFCVSALAKWCPEYYQQSNNCKTSVLPILYWSLEKQVSVYNRITVVHSTITVEHNTITVVHNTITVVHNTITVVHNTITVIHNTITVVHNTITVRRFRLVHNVVNRWHS